jgi:hypothetical protein
MFLDEEFYQLWSEIEFIFTILDSDIENRYNFIMLTIYKVLKRIRDYYIDDKKRYFGVVKYAKNHFRAS